MSSHPHAVKTSQLANRLALPSLEALLSGGGDARIVRDREGMNKYGCSSFPQTDTLSYGSSTASTISAAGFAASAELYWRLQDADRREATAVTYAREMNRVRAELLRLLDLTSLPGIEIIFGASGTDLHLYAAQLLCKTDAPLLVVMAEASETGTDVPAALQGCHFSNRTALGGAVTAGEAINSGGAIEVAAVRSRLDDGSQRPASLVDAEFESLAMNAIRAGRHVLMILTDVSKTGLVIPSPTCALNLKQRFPETVDILVDACQLRLANATVRSYLEQNFLMALTGSKFVTGPAFSGALLVPNRIAQRLRASALFPALIGYSARADWPPSWAARSTLVETANYGLLLRWEAALATLRDFHSLSEADIRIFVESFASAVQKRLTDDPALVPLPVEEIDRRGLMSRTTWDHIPTIFPFLMRHPESGTWLDRNEVSEIYQRMKEVTNHLPGIPAAMRRVTGTRCQLGQPVACGVRDGVPISALRLCIDMRLIVEALSAKGCGGDVVIANALRVLDKAAMLAADCRASRSVLAPCLT